MATQLAPTPILTGKPAEKVLKQLHIKPTAESNKGLENLLKLFQNEEDKI